MLTYKPMYEPLRAAYLHNIKRHKSWKRIWAWAIFIVGCLVYSVALWAVLESLVKP